MHRAARWMAALFVLVLISVFVAWQKESSLPRSPLGNSWELRVRKVSLGTEHHLSAEPFWKRIVRRLLPHEQRAPLGPFRGLTFQSAHESLVVWVAEYNTRDGKQTPVTLDSISIAMPDGQLVEGRRRILPDRSVACEFSCFARAEKTVDLRVRYGNQPLVVFTIPNPRLSYPKPWTPLPLPQTNRNAHTDVVLTGLSKKGAIAHVRAHSLHTNRVGWMAWRITTFDALGNWMQGSPTRWGGPTVPLLPSTHQPWKLLVQGDEYVSLGFVDLPATGISLAGQLNLRAEEIGVRYVAVISGGVHRMTNGGVVGDRSNGLAYQLSQPSLKLSRDSGTNWCIDFAARGPAILCISEGDRAIPISGRFRERLGADEGRIFPSAARTNLTWKRAGKMWSACFLTSSVAPGTTNLELEVIAPMPATEFFINPPTR